MAYDWNNHFAKLFKDYVAAAPEGSAFKALPLSTTLNTEQLKRPSLAFESEKAESNHRSLYAGVVKITHRGQVSEGGDEPELAAEEVEALDEYLRNEAAWAAFIQSLPVADREGWALLHRVVEQGVDKEQDDEKHTVDQTISVRIRAVAKR